MPMEVFWSGHRFICILNILLSVLVPKDQGPGGDGLSSFFHFLLLSLYFLSGQQGDTALPLSHESSTFILTAVVLELFLTIRASSFTFSAQKWSFLLVHFNPFPHPYWDLFPSSFFHSTQCKDRIIPVSWLECVILKCVTFFHWLAMQCAKYNGCKTQKLLSCEQYTDVMTMWEASRVTEVTDGFIDKTASSQHKNGKEYW